MIGDSFRMVSMDGLHKMRTGLLDAREVCNLNRLADTAYEIESILTHVHAEIGRRAANLEDMQASAPKASA